MSVEGQRLFSAPYSAHPLARLLLPGRARRRTPSVGGDLHQVRLLDRELLPVGERQPGHVGGHEPLQALGP